jgi:L-asparaginase II
MTAIEVGGADRFGWTSSDIAVTCSSHDASAEHLAIVRGLLEKASLDESAFRCGPHPPIDSQTREQLIRENISPRPIHNNCSGKHAGMLSACLAAGWPTAEYESPAHPLQKAIRETVARLSGVDASAIPMGVDGCAVPTFFLPVQSIALMFAKLVDPGSLSEQDAMAARRVCQAMQEHPRLVSWRGHLTCKLGQHLGTRLVSKGGAEGVFGIGLPDQKLGIAIKILDGSARGIAAVACRLLADFFPDADWPTIERDVNPPLLNTRQEIVGEIVPAW